MTESVFTELNGRAEEKKAIAFAEAKVKEREKKDWAEISYGDEKETCVDGSTEQSILLAFPSGYIVLYITDDPRYTSYASGIFNTEKARCRLWKEFLLAVKGQ